MLKPETIQIDPTQVSGTLTILATGLTDRWPNGDSLIDHRTAANASSYLGTTGQFDGDGDDLEDWNGGTYLKVYPPFQFHCGQCQFKSNGDRSTNRLSFISFKRVIKSKL